MKILYQELQGQSLPHNSEHTRKTRKRGPLIAARAADLFPSLERSSKNQSDLALKLPEISQKNASLSNQRELSINYAEERREKMRLKLEKLYQIKVPKNKRMADRALNVAQYSGKPPLLMARKNNGIIIVTDNGIPPLRPNWWG